MAEIKTRAIEITVPDIGDFKDVPVIEVLVAVGDAVAKDASLIVLETDKATIEVPSPTAGVVLSIAVKAGDRLNQGVAVLTLEVAGSGAVAEVPEKPAQAAPPPPAAVAPAPVATAPAAVSPAPVPADPVPVTASATAATAGAPIPPASPALRKLAREFGVDLVRVPATGPRGRLVREDVERYVRSELAKPASSTAPASGGIPGLLPWPSVDFTKFGAVDRQPLSRLRKISGANLARNWVMIPHVTNFEEADITDLEAFRVQVNREQKAEEPKLTMLAFLIKASVEVLKRYPDFNASLDGDELILKRYFHIGFAADTPNGLVVPVIRDADRKGIRDIAREAGELAALARGAKLKPEQMQGGCFTVSSLGGIGGTGFTPIINAPEVAILGVTRSELKPKWDGQQFQPRLMLLLNLSWDHRVIDGASAARFLVALASLLSDFRRVSL